ncbi:MAG TPA: rhomboid family intramembrane serine protease [Cytophagaceae bacterium]|jgi:membrane associated rhomboid family serine protease|nr:rhomboid family intramembrane serine protease [Cytophagaceae bacterium]
MRFLFTPVVKNLLIINIGIFFISNLLFSGLHLNDIFGLHSLYSQDFKAWQFVSYMFMHADFRHVFSNMFGLFVFGPMLEQRWGTRRFLFFYFFTGVCAGFLYWGINMYQTAQLKQEVESFLAHPTPDAYSSILKKNEKRYYDMNIDEIDKYYYEPNNPVYIEQATSNVVTVYSNKVSFSMVGASGAIFGILMAFALLFPNTEFYYFFLPIPIKAKYIVAFYGLYELYLEYTGNPDGIAHFAHLAGMFFGFILVKYWQKQRNTFY